MPNSPCRQSIYRLGRSCKVPSRDGSCGRASPLLQVVAGLVTQSPFSSWASGSLHPPLQDRTLEVRILLFGSSQRCCLFHLSPSCRGRSKETGAEREVAGS